MVKISVIILNYNAGHFLLESVQRVLHSTIPLKCIVVDNESSDDSIEKLILAHRGETRLQVIYNNKNLGFSAGCNRALPYADTEYILFLNPDCFIDPDTIEKMIQELEQHPQAGMASCLIRNMDGSEQRGCRRNFPTPWTALMRVAWLYKYFLGHKYLAGFDLTNTPLPEKTINMEAISGAFMLVRRQALAEVGPLDEGYRLHAEDLDWCKRFHQKNWQIIFVPHVVIRHIKGACSTKRFNFVIWHKHKGMWRFYRKIYRKQYPWIVNGMVGFAIWGRCFLHLMWANIVSFYSRRQKITKNA